MKIEDGLKKYIHEMIDDAYTRKEIIEKIVKEGHSEEFAKEALLQVMNDIVKNAGSH